MAERGGREGPYNAQSPLPNALTPVLNPCPPPSCPLLLLLPDVKLIPGAGFLQLALQSTPGGSYPLTNIEYAGPSYTPFNPSSATTSLVPDNTYTKIQSVTVTRPSYVRFTIPAGTVPLYGAIIQVIFTVNNNGQASAPTPTAPDGILLDVTGNDYFSATRATRTLQPTRAPTFTPTQVHI